MRTGLMKKRGDDEEAGDIDLTPMLDVVFILLIFFIVTSVFVTEAGIDVNKPQAQSGTPRSQDLILIAVNPEGEIWMGDEPVEPRFLRSRIERRLAEDPNARIVIQGDQEAANEQVMTIMRAAREADLPSVAISTETN